MLKRRRKRRNRLNVEGGRKLAMGEEAERLRKIVCEEVAREEATGGWIREINFSSEDIIAIVFFILTYIGIYLSKIAWSDVESVIYMVLIFYFGSKAFNALHRITQTIMQKKVAN